VAGNGPEALRIIAVSTLREFWSRSGRSDAEHPLRTWVHVVRAADWSRPTDIKEMFRSADILANDRVVFNIGGNKYRLIVAVHYRGKRVFIRFIGTHAEYEKIEAMTV
jgi:mRNA interferase HigB